MTNGNVEVWKAAARVKIDNELKDKETFLQVCMPAHVCRHYKHSQCLSVVRCLSTP